MTALCGGGASNVKQGVVSTNIVAGALITAGLEALSPWLVPVGALVDGFIYNATAQCTTDPPAMPTFDATDAQILALGLLAPNATTTLGKIQDLIMNYLWHQWCECTSATTPPLPTPQPPPAGTGVSNPQTATPCFTGTASYFPPTQSGPQPFSAADLTQQLLPVTGATQHDPFSTDPTWIQYGTPSGVTSIDFQAYQPNTSGCGGNSGPLMGEVFFFDNTGRQITYAQFSGNQYPTPNTSGTIPIPSNTVWWSVAAGYNPTVCGTVAGNATIKTQVYCGGGGTSLSNCCPPDPSITFALNNLIQLVLSIQAALTGLVIPPELVGYTNGAVHGALSGSGQFALVGQPLGLLVDINATSPAQGQVLGSPDRWFNLGWITPEIVGTPYAPQRIVYLTQQMQLPQLVDVINYTLGPGVVATVTELISVPTGALAQT